MWETGGPDRRVGTLSCIEFLLLTGYSHRVVMFVQKGVDMTREEFSRARKILGKTQRELAQLLGTSLKAVHSYEQGWRNIPLHVERQLYFLLFNQRGTPTNKKSCWSISHCPPERKHSCPAWEFNAGNLCWFISGTICQGTAQKSWKEKMEICKNCGVLNGIMQKLSDQ